MDSTALKLNRTPRVLLGWLALPCLVALFGIGYVLSETCDNALLKQLPSPDGRHTVTVYERKCSGTVAWTTNVSITAAGSALPNKAGNALVSFERHGSLLDPLLHREPEVTARWAGTNVLELAYSSAAPVQFGASEAAGVQVVHRRVR